MDGVSGDTAPAQERKRLNPFERWLSLWVGLCMIFGVALGTFFPTLTDLLRRIEFVEGSQINVPIAILLWLMIYPMMLRIDFVSVLGVGRRPRGILVTLFVNWLVKPFSMALLGWLFFKHVFQPWIDDGLADQYVAGVVILAAAPCTAPAYADAADSAPTAPRPSSRISTKSSPARRSMVTITSSTRPA